MSKETKRYFLQKAHHATAKTLGKGRFAWSLKLDGMRAYWDGGLLRGVEGLSFMEGAVPTGLYTINGNPMYAPNWFLDSLPPFPMEGEMWAGIGNFQKTMSICKKQYPHEGWRDVTFQVYDFPRPAAVFTPGEFAINNQKTKTITHSDFEIVRQRIADLGENYSRQVIFQGDKTHSQLGPDFAEHWIGQGSKRQWTVLKQNEFDGDLDKFNAEVFPTLLDQGHEGVMFRRHGSIWSNVRSYDILKLKPFNDAEGKVIGFVAGKETDRGSRNLGRIGALIVWCEKFKRRVKVSGLEDVEREVLVNNGSKILSTEELLDWTAQHPGEDVINHDIQCVKYPHGTTITFKYRELTDDGAPKDARIWRVRPEE